MMIRRLIVIPFALVATLAVAAPQDAAPKAPAPNAPAAAFISDGWGWSAYWWCLAALCDD